MNRVPFHGSRATPVAPPAEDLNVSTAELAEARADLDQARTRVRAAKRLVLAGEEGATVLHIAEWHEHQARRRIDLLEARAEIAAMRDGAP